MGASEVRGELSWGDPALGFPAQLWSVPFVCRHSWLGSLREDVASLASTPVASSHTRGVPTASAERAGTPLLARRQQVEQQRAAKCLDRPQVQACIYAALAAGGGNAAGAGEAAPAASEPSLAQALRAAHSDADRSSPQAKRSSRHAPDRQGWECGSQGGIPALHHPAEEGCAPGGPEHGASGAGGARRRLAPCRGDQQHLQQQQAQAGAGCSEVVAEELARLGQSLQALERCVAALAEQLQPQQQGGVPEPGQWPQLGLQQEAGPQWRAQPEQRQQQEQQTAHPHVQVQLQEVQGQRLADAVQGQQEQAAASPAALPSTAKGYAATAASPAADL